MNVRQGAEKQEKHNAIMPMIARMCVWEVIVLVECNCLRQLCFIFGSFDLLARRE